MSETRNRKPEEITENAVELVLNQLARIPHSRFVATPEEKSHIVAFLQAAVDEVEHRIKTPRVAFSLAAVLAPEECPNIPDEPIASQAKWEEAKSGGKQAAAATASATATREAGQAQREDGEE